MIALLTTLTLNPLLNSVTLSNAYQALDKKYLLGAASSSGTWITKIQSRDKDGLIVEPAFKSFSEAGTTTCNLGFQKLMVQLKRLEKVPMGRRALIAPKDLVRNYRIN